jgi:hypothetical protein
MQIAAASFATRLEIHFDPPIDDCDSHHRRLCILRAASKTGPPRKVIARNLFLSRIFSGGWRVFWRIGLARRRGARRFRRRRFSRCCFRAR